MEDKKGAHLAQGSTADIHAWGDDDKIIKLFYPDFSRDYVQYEYDINVKAMNAGLPTPKVYELTELEGRLGIVYERIEGPVMLELMFAQPDRVEDLATAFAEMHVQIHRAPVTGFPPVREALANVTKMSPWLNAPQRKQILSILETLPTGDGLIHGDFHPGNVLMSAKGPMVMDWLTAKQEHPLADVANTVVILRWASIPSDDDDMRARIDVVRSDFLQVYKSRHLELVPDTRWEQVERWMILLIVARLALNDEDERQDLLNGLETLWKDTDQAGKPSRFTRRRTGCQLQTH
jgi:uncharacterized protein (TIGR02172 family)